MLRTFTRHLIYNGINSSKFVKKCVAINLGSVGSGSETVHSQVFLNKCYFHYDGSGDDNNERPRFRQRKKFSQEDPFDLDEENEWEPQTSYRRKSSTHFDRDRGKHGHRDIFKPRRSSNFSWRRDFDESFEEDGREEQREIGSRIKKRDWNLSHLTSVEKNFYVEHPEVAEKSEIDIDGFYKEHSITVSGDDRPRPVSSFHEANFPEQVNSYLEKIRWSQPTPIQSLGWPLSLSGKNFVGIAQTGSGKTLGYILPALVHIKHQRQVMQGEGPIALVLAPTRELAQQIKSVAVEFGRLLGIRSCCVFGGQSKLSQARHLSQGPEIVVATPGRLLDFLEMDVVNLDRTTYVVLDEADRMLDMGFEPQIRKILGQIRPDRQILMWSATWPEEIQQLAHDFLGEFTQVNIGSAKLMANPNIEQIVNVCERAEKFDFLLQELEKAIDDEHMGKTLIFVQTKSQADFLTHRLRKHRFNTLAIHGDKTQMVRDKTLSSFRNGKTDILVATDVAARGLDVDDIKLVVNYDYPNTVDDYIHRIGRTARASKKGTAITFVSDEDAGKLNDLIKVLKDSGQPIPQELSDLARLHSKLGKKAPNRNKFGSPRRNYQSWNNGSFERRKSW